MNGPTLTKKFHFEKGRRSAKQLQEGEAPPPVPPGKVPHVSRLMALAVRLEQLLRDGLVADQAELARIGHVSRSRITQILNLLNLAPDIQEAVLFLPRTKKGPAPLTEVDLRPIAGELDWKKQRRMWKSLSTQDH